MRKYPERNAEVVSQAIFSEQVHFLEQVGEWVKIETMVDNYPGWIKREDLHQRENKFLKDSDSSFVQVSRNAAHLYHVHDTIYGPTLTLPFESQLKVIESLDERWLKVTMHNQQEAYIQRGDVAPVSNRLTCFNEVCAFSQNFLGLPYTWGGRSSFGYDCSGFVQMLYRQMGIFLPRDSKDQCHWNGFFEVSIEQMQAGDLIFFGWDLERIRHVGMCVGEQNFINATVLENMPYIHMSSVNGSEWQEGTGKYPFRTVRRLES
jgi:cell wall-associated NlpC family hydrolase